MPQEGEEVDDDDVQIDEPEPEMQPLKARGKFEYIEQHRLLQIRFSYYFESNGTFFFQRNDKIEGMEALYEIIDKFVENKENLQPLQSIEAGENCLLYSDGEYNRARIVEVLEEPSNSCLVYSLDTGFLDDNIPTSDLFETTDEITEKIKFQAMLARLAGIKPLNDEGYSDEEIEKMKEIIEENQYHLYVYSVRLNHNVDWYQKWGLNFYDVILVSKPDPENTKILNQIFIENGKF